MHRHAVKTIVDVEDVNAVRGGLLLDTILMDALRADERDER